MTTTTYYELNIAEGTDIVNPLTVDNPNYEKIDEVMHDNAVSGVTLATEIANATVHAITRENSECAVIRFIATSNWKAGDTVTVDGVPVTALLPSGETLPDGAYVINANVLCILTGTNLTVYAERKKTVNANEIAYNETTVGAELTALNSNLVWKKHSEAQGNRTISLPQTFNELYILVEYSNYDSAIIVPQALIPSTGERIFYADGGYRTNDSRNCKIKVSANGVALGALWQDGIDGTNSTWVYVWYR